MFGILRQVALLLAGMTLLAGFASAGQVHAKVDISRQTMTVSMDGGQRYTWKVSTARPGKTTPRGRFTAKWLSKYHKSSLYNNAPMPFSIFFNGNYAVHGTDQIAYLGRPASAGCVRLHPDQAEILFKMTQTVGLDNTVIEIVD